MSRYQIAFFGVIVLVLLAFAGDIAVAYARQADNRKAKRKEETYTRPRPTKPVRPVIPSQNRYQQDKVFLENAKVLYKAQQWNDTVERQIVSGDVKFRQGSMWMFCDSAYYYPGINSLDAFGHVRMEQGDTLFVFADQLFYNGNERLAKLTNGPSEPTVRLKDPSGELLTDTLDYDVNLEIGYYGCGGTLKDEVNTLTSLYGQYNSKTKDAEFFYDVELINHKDNLTLLSDTLYYNTATHLAQIDSPTDIYGPNDTIYTARGWYDTQLNNLQMDSRSTIIHKDSLGRATFLEGDSIVYDNATRISRAYQYRDITKLSSPTVLTDTASKMILISSFGMYNDSTKEAFATGYPLLKEYSRSDTLFLRADTIYTFMRQDTVWTTQAEIEREKLREAYIADFEYLEWPADPEMLAPISQEEMLGIMLRWFDAQPLPDTAPAALPAAAPVADIMTEADSIALNQAADIATAPETQMPPEKLIKSIRDYHVAMAYPRGRFFNSDMQGVADTLEFHENDSLMYLKRKPAVWSGERQITGKEIILHFNDSTIDHALLPQTGLMVEHVEEEYYNQLSGKTMEAWFEDDYLKRLHAEGNVQVIMLPIENDSSYNKLVDAESSHLTVDMKDRKIERIKMWPEVTGNTTPLFLVKKAQKYLPNFIWLEAIRPKSSIVDGKVRWDDELGEISEQLEFYFKED